MSPPVHQQWCSFSVIDKGGKHFTFHFPLVRIIHSLYPHSIEKHRMSSLVVPPFCGSSGETCIVHTLLLFVTFFIQPSLIQSHPHSCLEILASGLSSWLLPPWLTWMYLITTGCRGESPLSLFLYLGRIVLSPLGAIWAPSLESICLFSGDYSFISLYDTVGRLLY